MRPYRLISPALFLLDPERAHRLTLMALRLPGVPAARAPPQLATTVAGLTFSNPVGIAAGFDKNAEAADALLRLGFGFAEVGTVTPRAQAGNPRPRLFRLVQDRAVINRMGFNNEGAAKVALRLARRGRVGRGAGAGAGGVLGINIGANKDAPDRIGDYAAMTTAMAPLADYLTVNISSPNTPGLRDLQDQGALAALLDAVLAARKRLNRAAARPPIFLKLAPDLERADIDRICRIAIDRGIDALIVSNTTISRPPLASRHAGEEGGLSGEPLRELALNRLREFRAASGGQIALIGVGGIASAEDAWVRIRAGASLVQLYSALVYEGPGLVRTILAGLAARLAQHGMASIAEAVGSE